MVEPQARRYTKLPEISWLEGGFDFFSSFDGRNSLHAKSRVFKMPQVATYPLSRRTRQRLWKRDTLLHKLGAAHKEAGRAWNFVKITVPQAPQAVNHDTFQFELLKDKLHDAQEGDGHYLQP